MTTTVKKEFCSFSIRSQGSTRRVIVSLCPLNTRVESVGCSDGEPPEIYRTPQLAIAVYDEIWMDAGGNERERERGIGFIESIEGGEEFADYPDSSWFLGYEFDGKGGDWTKRIEYLKRRRAEEEESRLIRAIPRYLEREMKEGLTSSFLHSAKGCYNDGVLTIRCEHKIHLTQLSQEKHLEAIQKAAEHVYGTPVKVELELVQKRQSA